MAWWNGFGSGASSLAQRAIDKMSAYVGINEHRNRDVVAAFNRNAGVAANEPWCTSSLTACDERLPKTASVAALQEYLQNRGVFRPGIEGAKPGDTLIFKNDGESHAAMLKSVNPDGTYSILHGNWGDALRENTVSTAQLRNMGLTGYGDASSLPSIQGANAMQVSVANLSGFSAPATPDRGMGIDPATRGA